MLARTAAGRLARRAGMPEDEIGEGGEAHMKLTVVGSGDAFGSGGRLQTCFHVAAPGGDILIDCGATSIIGLQQRGLDPNRVSHDICIASTR